MMEVCLPTSLKMFTIVECGNVIFKEKKYRISDILTLYVLFVCSSITVDIVVTTTVQSVVIRKYPSHCLVPQVSCCIFEMYRLKSVCIIAVDNAISSARK